MNPFGRWRHVPQLIARRTMLAPSEFLSAALPKENMGARRMFFRMRIEGAVEGGGQTARRAKQARRKLLRKLPVGNREFLKRLPDGERTRAMTTCIGGFKRSRVYQNQRSSRTVYDENLHERSLRGAFPRRTSRFAAERAGFAIDRGSMRKKKGFCSSAAVRGKMKECCSSAAAERLRYFFLAKGVR